ncbi:hypothetical protein LEP1GSC170_6067 [Leptospira interrogans serovar Bataviae str. HAI135]|nr:hypothetical protein LEP1GSC170_6067 [Leptospira interrogans serovar Bataviae str. HAI135]
MVQFNFDLSENFNFINDLDKKLQINLLATMEQKQNWIVYS